MSKCLTTQQDVLNRDEYLLKLKSSSVDKNGSNGQFSTFSEWIKTFTMMVIWIELWGHHGNLMWHYFDDATCFYVVLFTLKCCKRKKQTKNGVKKEVNIPITSPVAFFSVFSLSPGLKLWPTRWGGLLKHRLSLNRNMRWWFPGSDICGCDFWVNLLVRQQHVTQWVQIRRAKVDGVQIKFMVHSDFIRNFYPTVECTERCVSTVLTDITVMRHKAKSANWIFKCAQC